MSNATAAHPKEIARSDAFRLRWVFIALIVLGGIVNYLDRSTLSIGNTTIAKELGFNALQMGLLLSAFSWPYALANLPAGYLIDRFGVKKMFLAAAICWSLVAIGTSVLQSFIAIYIARALLGVAESPFFASGLKASQLWFARRERTMPVSIVNTGSQIANAIAPPFLTFLLLGNGWRTMFVIVGALGFIVAGIWWFSYRDPKREEEVAIKGAAELEAELKADEPAGQARANWFSLLKRPNTWFMMLGAFGIFYTVWVYLTWLPSFLQKSRGFSLTATGWLAALPFLCGIVGVLFGGWLSGRLIKAGWPTLRARKLPIVGGAVLAAAAVLPVAYVSDNVLTIALLCLGYFAAQIPIGCIWTLASDIAERHLVASLGAIQNFGGFLGAAVGPVVTGAILQATNSYDLVFLVAGILLLVGAISYGFFVREDRPKVVT
jgi:sugar phosphate permease